MTKATGWETLREYGSLSTPKLTDLISVDRELKFVIRAGELALKLAQDLPSSWVTDDRVRSLSMWNAALVAYGRCFMESAHHARLDEDTLRAVSDKADDAIKAHRYFINQRDKFVAHSVNRFESLGVALMISERRALDVGAYVVKQVQESQHNMRVLRRLARILDAEISLRIEALKIIVLSEAISLNPDELAALPELQWSPVQLDKARGGGAP